MIRRITSHQLVSVVIEHDRGETVILKASQIFHVEQSLAYKAIDTYLGRSSFMELQEDFPENVIIKADHVEIIKSRELEPKLKYALRFANKNMDEFIWKSWQSKE